MTPNSPSPAQPQPLALPGVRRFDLTGRTAVITGGSKGLGEAMAAGLASAGAEVLLVSRHLEEVQAAAARIAREHGRRALSLAADVTSPEQAESMVAEAIRQLGKVDILINNAGINIRGPIEQLTPDQFRQVMEVNVTGPWLCSRALLRHLKQRGSGRIINMASAVGFIGLANRTPYATSKGAVAQFTRTLALEVAAQGITVNAICPGPFLTDMNIPIANTEDGRKFVVGATALRRWGELREIQGAAIFLASDAASYVTGSMLFVDGGWTAQ